jgi:hypothetical protein
MGQARGPRQNGLFHRNPPVGGDALNVGLCIITEDTIGVDNYMDLYCPHCRVIPRGRPSVE